EFARLAPVAKAQLLRECIPRLLAEAPSWVVDGARVRGADPSEEWLAGPTSTIRLFRLLATSLDPIAPAGQTALRRGAAAPRPGAVAACGAGPTAASRSRSSPPARSTPSCTAASAATC